MHAYVLLSFDLKQNADAETRKSFDEALERCGWKDCPDVASTKTKKFADGGAAGEVKTAAYMEVYESSLSANVKEISCVIHSGDSEPLQRTFLHPKYNKLTYGEPFPIAR
ncbi:hypothetical protein ACVK1X_004927 [Pseudomonas sp. PvR086]